MRKPAFSVCYLKRIYHYQVRCYNIMHDKLFCYSLNLHPHALSVYG